MFSLRRNRKDQRSDLELIAAYRDNDDREALGVLFERYTHLVFGVSIKYLKDVDESKDAVMNIFEKLLKELKVHEVTNFSSWLHTLTRNFCLMKLRSEKTEFRRQLDYHKFEVRDMDFHMDPHQENGTVSESKLKALEKAIDGLKDEQQICIRLFYLENKSYAQICEETGYQLKHVKSYIQNGKRNLKTRLEDDNPENETRR